MLLKKHHRHFRRSYILDNLGLERLHMYIEEEVIRQFHHSHTCSSKGIQGIKSGQLSGKRDLK